MRKTYVYRIVGSYPEIDPYNGPQAWRDEGRDEGGVDQDGSKIGVPFYWPTPHLYLSRSGAEKRATLLGLWGAEVHVERSQPVRWEGE